MFLLLALQIQRMYFFESIFFLNNKSADKLKAVSFTDDMLLHKICIISRYQESVYFSVLVWHKFHDPT